MRGGRAVPHRLRLPQAEARYDTGGRARSCLDLSRSFVVGDRWRDIEMGLSGGHEGRCWSKPATAGREAARPPANIRRCPSSGTLIEASRAWILRNSVNNSDPLPGDCERESRLLTLLDAFRATPRGRHRRSDRRRVHLRPRGARVARSAGADPSIRLHADSARRRGQRGEQRGRARRPHAHRRRSQARTRRASACVASLAATSTRAACPSPQGYCTPVKTRILAGGVHTAKQQIVRIDRVVVDRLRREEPRGIRRARR